jgi:hypothetical protein
MMKDFEVTYCVGETFNLTFSTDIKNEISVLFDVENRLRVNSIYLKNIARDNKWYYEDNIEFAYTNEIEFLFIHHFDLSETVRMFFKSLIDGNAYYPNLKYVYLIGCNGRYMRESSYDNLIHFYEKRRYECDYTVLDGRDSIKEIGTNLVFWMMEDDNDY